MPVSKSLRFQVLRRDHFACQYCGGRAPDVVLAVDHVIPAALGGPDTPDNLITACRDCNGGKAATPPDAEQVQGVSDRNRQWAAAMAQLATEAADGRRALGWFTDCWDGYRHADGSGLPIPDNWRSSVEVWTQRGLSQEDIEHAVSTAMGNASVPAPDVFRYMAGVCWRMLRDREEVVAQRMTER